MLILTEDSKADVSEFRDKGIIVKKYPQPKVKKFDINYYKYYLYTPYFKMWKNVVYLDADIIVRKDINDLTDLRGYNVASDSKPLREQFYKDKDLDDYDLTRESFNAGVQVFNTADIIENNTHSDLINLTNKIGKNIKQPDQTIFNLYYYHTFNMIDSNYNFFGRWIDNDSMHAQSKIFHVIFGDVFAHRHYVMRAMLSITIN